MHTKRKTQTQNPIKQWEVHKNNDWRKTTGPSPENWKQPKSAGVGLNAFYLRIILALDAIIAKTLNILRSELRLPNKSNT